MARPAAAFRDYQWALPLMSRLPMPLAYAAAAWRGRHALRAQGDWAERAQGLRYIAQRSDEAWQQMNPSLPLRDRARQTCERYETWAEEELEGLWLGRGDDFRFNGLDVEPARAALAAPGEPRGLVLVQAHFNNPTLCCAAIGKAAGRPVWMTVSGIYEDPRVHPAVRHLFALKYRGAERHLHGGRLLHTEDSASVRLLYRALERGEIVIVVADLPPTPGQPGVAVPWVDGERWLAPGAWRLVQRTGSAVGTAWLDRPRPGRWRLNVQRHDGPQPITAVRSAYACLARVLRAQPGRWWAAHLLHDTPTAPQPSDAHHPNAPGTPT